MAKIDVTYLENLCKILDSGIEKKDRTGVGTITYPFVTIRHDMSDGFPLLTLRKMPWISALTELEGFLKGITNKTWYQSRGCHFWDGWASSKAIQEWEKNNHPIQSDDERKEVMRSLTDLGPIYGSQWNYFSGGVSEASNQLKYVRDTLRDNPASRRMVVSSWNPDFNDSMALPACHVLWQVWVSGEKLNLAFYQRSCDFILGHNLTGYGMLLLLLCKESGYTPGVLGATYADCHIYLNHIEGVRELLHRPVTIPAPVVQFKTWQGFDNWRATDMLLSKYNPAGKIEFPVAI